MKVKLDVREYLCYNVSMMNTQDRPEFATQEDAIDWMYEQVDDPCIDNERFAFEDDLNALRLYEEQDMRGCCGSFDSTVIVAGKPARIGCNYGH